MMARRDRGTWGCLAGAGAGGFWGRWLLGLCEAGLGWFDVLRVDGFKREALDAVIGLKNGFFGRKSRLRVCPWIRAGF